MAMQLVTIPWVILDVSAMLGTVVMVKCVSTLMNAVQLLMDVEATQNASTRQGIIDANVKGNLHRRGKCVPMSTGA